MLFKQYPQMQPCTIVIIIIIPVAIYFSVANLCCNLHVWPIWKLYCAVQLPHMHAQAVKQSVCLSVVVVVIINTKITRSHVLGICVCCKHNQSVGIGEKLVCTCFELFKKAQQCYKLCIFCLACLWFIDHTHSFSIIVC